MEAFNLVDGFNGLLAINLIIINSILLFINLKNNQLEFSTFLTAQIVILISFLLFNFPKAKIFLGDTFWFVSFRRISSFKYNYYKII